MEIPSGALQLIEADGGQKWLKEAVATYSYDAGTLSVGLDYEGVHVTRLDADGTEIGTRHLSLDDLADMITAKNVPPNQHPLFYEDVPY